MEELFTGSNTTNNVEDNEQYRLGEKSRLLAPTKYLETFP